MTRFTGTSITITTGHSQWLSTTRSIPYWTTSVFSSTVTDLVVNYESVTSSAWVVLWLTLHNWTLNFWILLWLNDWTESEPQFESYVTTDGQSASLSWNKAPIWGIIPDLYYCQTVAGLLMCALLSDERTSLSFATAADLRQRSHSRVRVPWDSQPYFTVSDSRLPFSLPPTTRGATVEVFDPASTQDMFELSQCQNYFTTGGLPPISSAWRQAPWDSWPEFFFNWTLAVIVLM
jgi:hypothetical protein